MTVESHWEKLKHIDLAHLNRPRLDRLIDIIIRETIPRCLLRLPQNRFSSFRSESLTSTQVKAKQAWKRLLTTRIKGTYNTHLPTWTCNCGSQKYNPHLFCKHLVHAATIALTQASLPSSTLLDRFRDIPAEFFKSLHLRTSIPFYYIPNITTINSSAISPPAENVSDDFSDMDPDDCQSHTLDLLAAKDRFRRNLQTATVLDSNSDDQFFHTFLRRSSGFNDFIEEFSTLLRMRNTPRTWAEGDSIWGYRPREGSESNLE